MPIPFLRFLRHDAVNKLPREQANIGNVLLAMGLLTREELLAGIEAKLAADRDSLLGEVLIARGYITRAQLERALSRQAEIVGPRSYAEQIKTAVAKGVATMEGDSVASAEVREVADRLAKKAK